MLRAARILLYINFALALYLQVLIPQSRRLVGQPLEELIAIETYFSYPGILKDALVETARFPHPLEDGGESSRYYHFLNHPNGLALNCCGLDGRSRLMRGFYGKRTLIIPGKGNSFLDIFGNGSCKDRLLSSFSICQYMHFSSDVADGYFKINCIEPYWDESSIKFCGSLCIPSIFLSSIELSQEVRDFISFESDSGVYDINAIRMGLLFGRFIFSISLSGKVLEACVIVSGSKLSLPGASISFS